MRPAHLKPAAILAADKPHGTRVKYMGGCKCVKCRAANSTYELSRLAMRAAGKGNGLVPADAAREHLNKLSRAGVGRRTVARLTDISATTLQMIKAGHRKNLRAMSEKRILAVTETALRIPPQTTKTNSNLRGIKKVLRQVGTARTLDHRRHGNTQRATA